MNSSTDLTMFLYVDPRCETLRAFYTNRILDHNAAIYNNQFADSGFDLGLPTNLQITKKISNKIPLGVHCSMYSFSASSNNNTNTNINTNTNTNTNNNTNNNTNKTPQAYYLYPRSSIIKTPLRLSNSVGIIDRGYRGEITAVVDMIDQQRDTFDMYAMDRHFQICHPSLQPFKVVLVDAKEELGLTERGNGGFGSTGR
jgi:dUTP pyrophosphatase